MISVATRAHFGTHNGTVIRTPHDAQQVETTHVHGAIHDDSLLVHGHDDYRSSNELLMQNTEQTSQAHSDVPKLLTPNCLNFVAYRRVIRLSRLTNREELEEKEEQ